MEIKIFFKDYWLKTQQYTNKLNHKINTSKIETI